MVVHYPRTVWKNCYAEHEVTGKKYNTIVIQYCSGWEESGFSRFTEDLEASPAYLAEGGRGSAGRLGSVGSVKLPRPTTD